MLRIATLVLAASAVIASPTTADEKFLESIDTSKLPLGISWPHELGLTKRQLGAGAALPLLKLPYQTYQAAKWDRKNDVYKFANIRFAAPPLGPLRFALPAPPAPAAGIANGKYGPTCPQTTLTTFVGVLPKAVSGIANAFIGNIVDKAIGKGSSEDCLFLDVYVPGAVARASAPAADLPVINYVYGGAYVMGTKAASDGGAMIASAGNKALFVAGNYRLGAFGWLAGPEVEKEGVVNAGIHDQRAMLQWIQDYIHLVGGNKNRVSAWGESAGAGSLYHHLVLKGGEMDPLFKTAVLQSPAFALKMDRQGKIRDEFLQYAKLAGCDTTKSETIMTCLRGQSSAILRAANDKISTLAPMGSFAFGPVPDGIYIRQLPALEYDQGHYFKGINAIIPSHVKDEASMFVPPAVTTDEIFANWTSVLFNTAPSLEQFRPEFEKLYPPLSSVAGKQLFKNVNARANHYVRDSSFTCNTRSIAQAYPGKSYNIQYSSPPGTHGADILPVFLASAPHGAYKEYRSYLASFVLSDGNPNPYRIQTMPEWPLANVSGESVTNLLDFNQGKANVVTDETNKKEYCDFWLRWSKQATEALAKPVA